VRTALILASVSIFIISLSGCFVAADLHPVHGPATLESHKAVLKPSGAFSSGKFYADLQEDRVFGDDECKGRWKSAAPPASAGANDMASVWDTVYGDGYYQLQVLLAKKCARGSGTCKEKRILDAEICLINNRSSKATRVGVAKDSTGNIYKIVFF